LSHDPERADEHAEASRAGGIARHDAEARSLRDEVRQAIDDVKAGKLSPGAGSVVFQGYRLLREIDAEENRAPDAEMFIASIQRLRDNPDVPDLSEPAANSPHGGNAGVVDMSDPDAPRLEDYQGRADEYIRDKAAHDATPLSHLSIAERRKRWQRNRKPA
jgi:hypothetical protein